MDNMRVTSFQKIANGYEWQKRNAQGLVRGPFKRREAIDTHLMLEPPLISWALTGCNHPHLVPTVSKIVGKSMCYRWDSTDGRRIMISNDHNTRSEERRVGKEWRYWRDWSSDVCSSDLRPCTRAIQKKRSDRHAPDARAAAHLVGPDWVQPPTPGAHGQQNRGQVHVLPLGLHRW